MNEFEREAIALRNQGKTLPAGVQENFEQADKNGDFKWFTANWRQHRQVFAVHFLATFGTNTPRNGIWEEGLVPWLLRNQAHISNGDQNVTLISTEVIFKWF